jgi:NDP-sugar pyrophosphorylase family protein
MKNKISITINEKILRDIDSIVDNIFIRNRSQAIEHLIKKALKETKIAVILVGDSRPSKDKLLNRYALRVNHLAVIEKALKKLGDSSFNNIYIIGDHSNLTNIFKIIGDGTDYKFKIEYINEEIQEGSASALKLLKGRVKTTFLVVQSDIIFDDVNLNELWQQHLQERTTATMIVCSDILPVDKARYGHVTVGGSKVLSYIEKPIGRNFKSSIFFGGIFVAEPEIFSYYGKSLELDIFPELAKRGVLGGRMSSTEHLHIHTHEDLINVRKKLIENTQSK